MDIDDETSETLLEVGSDELLSADDLRLPESASILVRVHAVRAWLTRRYADTSIDIGEAALALQKMAQTFQEAPHVRRRERQQQEARLAQIQQVLTEAQQRLRTYEEAQALLEECIAHTSGDRVLVEYYLVLEDLVQSATTMAAQSPREQALADVQHRLEHVGAPNEEV